MKFDRTDRFTTPVPTWRTTAKRALMWMYERRLLSAAATSWIYNRMGLWLA